MAVEPVEIVEAASVAVVPAAEEPAAQTAVLDWTWDLVPSFVVAVRSACSALVGCMVVLVILVVQVLLERIAQ